MSLIERAPTDYTKDSEWALLFPPYYKVIVKCNPPHRLVDNSIFIISNEAVHHMRRVECRTQTMADPLLAVMVSLSRFVLK